ncbi:hypothetical protein Tco_0949358 [Tanacetum coccineum]
MIRRLGAAGYGGAQNRVGNANPGQARQVNGPQLATGRPHIKELHSTQSSIDSEILQRQRLLKQAHEMGNLALNVDNVFQADDCDAYDSDVDEAPTAQTMFMEKSIIPQIYQNLKDSFQNKPSLPVNDTPDFNSIFVIGQMKASLQGKDNIIQKLKMKISHLKETQENAAFRAENAKIKQHYKELYDSIKITRAKHLEQITSLKMKMRVYRFPTQNTSRVSQQIWLNQKYWHQESMDMSNIARNQVKNELRTDEWIKNKEIKAEAREIMPQPSSVNCS